MAKNVIQVQKVQKDIVAKSSTDLVLERACRIAYYYPQYTPYDVMALNIKLQRYLLDTARKIQAEKMTQLLKIGEITNEPYKGREKMVSQALNYYEGIIDG